MSLLIRPNCGLLISVEGSSGVGKTFTVEKLKDNYDIITTSEITEQKNNIDNIILSAINTLNNNYDIFLSKAEPLKTFMLLSTMYISYYENVIIPNLRMNKVVVMDRGIDSPSILQSVLFLINDDNFTKMMSLQKTFLDILLKFVFQPDFTILIENDLDICIKNLKRRENITLTSIQLVFLQKVHEVFKNLPPDERYIRVNTNNAYIEISKLIERHGKKPFMDVVN